MTDRVLALVLARSARFLPAVLDGLAGQSIPPSSSTAVVPADADADVRQILDDAGVAVLDAESLTDAAARVLADLDSQSTGAAAQAAGAALDESDPERLDAKRGPNDPWLWILDDESVPAPDALAQLLAAAAAVASDPAQPKDVDTSQNPDERDNAAESEIPAEPDLAERADAHSEAGLPVGVFGAKQRRDDATLRNVGLTMTPWARPLPGIELGEIDQGQHDHRHEVLAVSRSGMLIRSSLWSALRGFDPALHGVLADLDLGRRANLAGYRVVVAPRAVVTRYGDDVGADAPAPGGPGLPPWARGEQVYLRLVSEPVLVLPWVVLTVIVGALGRIVLGISAADTLGGLRSAGSSLAALARVDRVIAGRRRAAATTTRPGRAQTKRLIASRSEVQRFHRERWHRARQVDRDDVTPHQIAPVVLHDHPCQPTRHPRQPTRHPGSARWFTLAVLVPGLLGLLALSRIWGAGPVTSAALPGVPSSIRPLLLALFSGWRDVGLGEAGPPDPLLGPLSVLGVLAGGSPARAVRWLLLLAPGLAAAVGWWLAASLRTATRWRVLAALVWSAVPGFLLAVSGGRVGGVLAHLGLAASAAALICALGTPRRRSVWAWTGLGALTVWCSVAGAPILLLPMIVVLVGVAWWTRRPAAAVMTSVAVIALLPVLIREPSALAADPGVPAPAQPFRAALILLGWPGRPGPWPDGSYTDVIGVVALVLGALPLLLALAALPVAWSGRHGSTTARWALGLVALGMGAAVASALRAVAVTGSGSSLVVVHGWPGAGTSLVALGLLLTALVGLPDSRAIQVLQGPVRDRRRVETGVTVWVVASLCLLPLAAMSGWAWLIRTSPPAGSVTRNGIAMPAGAAVISASADHTRILVVHPMATGRDAASGETDVARTAPRLSLVRGDGPRLDRMAASLSTRAFGRASSSRVDTADLALAQAFADVVMGSTPAQEAFAPFGVGALVVLPGPGAGTVAAKLSGTAGLLETGQVRGVRAFRVLPLSAGGVNAPDRPSALRLMAVSDVAEPSVWTALPWLADGSRVTSTVPAAGRPRTVAISERSSSHWSGVLGGKALRPVSIDGWQQGFEVPATTRPETLVIRYRDPWQTVLSAMLALSVAVMTLLAVPLRGSRG